MELLKNCPVCGGNNFESFISCKDYTVSSETFCVVNCTSCSFKFTNPRPFVDEIGKYYDSPEYISHSNTKKGLLNTLYQHIRKYTIAKKIKLIEQLQNGAEKTILDVGCGTGEFLNACKGAGWKIQGVEPGENARRFAIESYGLNVSDEAVLENLPDQSFSIITLWHVLEHVHNLQERVQTLHRLLKDDGTLIIAVPNVQSYDADHYKEHWAAFDVPRHLYHFSRKNISDLFARQNMKVVNTLPMIFDAYYVSLLSEKYKKPSIFNYIKAFLQGYRSNSLAAKNGNNYSSIIYLIKKES